MTETTANEAKTFTVILTEEERDIVMATLAATFEEALVSALRGEELGTKYLDPIAGVFLKFGDAPSN